MADPANVDSRGSPYDYGSIMHYPSRRAGQLVLEPIPDANVRIGQRDGLSETDIAQANNMYMCVGKISNIYCTKYNFPKSADWLFASRVLLSQKYTLFLRISKLFFYFQAVSKHRKSGWKVCVFFKDIICHINLADFTFRRPLNTLIAQRGFLNAHVPLSSTAQRNTWSLKWCMFHFFLVDGVSTLDMPEEPDMEDEGSGEKNKGGKFKGKTTITITTNKSNKSNKSKYASGDHKQTIANKPSG